MRKLIGILLAMCLCIGAGVPLCAQEKQLEVVSFALEENALTAKNEPVYDNNQQKCALVIIAGMGDEALRFNVGNSFIKVDERTSDGERVYRMWIPEGVVKLTISSGTGAFKPVDYFFNPRVKRAETYMMRLKLSKASSAIGKQYLEFVIDPPTAYLEVDGQAWGLVNGVAYRQLPKGRYTYSIRAKDYYSDGGIVDFSDLSAKRVVEIKLKPHFGWLNVESDLTGVTVFVDDEIVADDLHHLKLSSGEHSLRASKERYLPFSQTFTIADEKETPVALALKPNFATVKIDCDPDVEIFIDEKPAGRGTWQGELMAGDYRLELRKPSHRNYSRTLTVDKVGEPMTVTFKDFTPIYGSANIESTPPRATVVIDGKDYGTAPIHIPELLIGNHSIRLSLSGYSSATARFSIEEGKQADLAYTLEKMPGFGTSPNDSTQQDDRSIEVLDKYLAIVDVEPRLRSFGEALEPDSLMALNSARYQAMAAYGRLLEANMLGALSKSITADDMSVDEELDFDYAKSVITKVVARILNNKRFEIVDSDVYPEGSAYYAALSLQWRGTVDQLAKEMTSGFAEYISRIVSNPDAAERVRSRFNQAVYARLGLPADSAAAPDPVIEGADIDLGKFDRLVAEEPMLRTFGDGMDSDAESAKKFAYAAAKWAYKNMLSANLSRSLATTNNLDQSLPELNDFIDKALEPILACEFTVVDSEVAHLPDGTYHAAVCLEWPGTVEELLTDLTTNLK